MNIMDFFEANAQSLLIGGLVILAVIAIALLVAVLKRSSQRRKHREQLEYRAREAALNRALSNELHSGSGKKSQRPVEVHYNGGVAAPRNVKMLRLTELSDRVTKEYLFRRDETFFLGEEYSKVIVLNQSNKHRTFCKIYPVGSTVCVCSVNHETGRLLRGKRSKELSELGVRMMSGDIIQLPGANFRVEFF